MRVPTKVSRQRKDVFRLEQEREKLGSELSEAQNMYMQSLEDVKVSRSGKVRRHMTGPNTTRFNGSSDGDP